jgi:hypothetical protein
MRRALLLFGLVCFVATISGCCCLTEDYESTTMATPYPCPYPSLSVDEARSAAKPVNYTEMMDTPIGGVVCFTGRVDSVSREYGILGKYNIKAMVNDTEPEWGPYAVYVLYQGTPPKAGDTIKVWGRYKGSHILPPTLAQIEVDAIHIESVD